MRRKAITLWGWAPPTAYTPPPYAKHFLDLCTAGLELDIGLEDGAFSETGSVLTQATEKYLFYSLPKILRYKKHPREIYEKCKILSLHRYTEHPTLWRGLLPVDDYLPTI